MTDTAASSAPFGALDVDAQLQQIIDHTSAAVFVKDLDGRFLFVNREFERMKGMPVDAIVGRRDGEVFPAAALELRRNDLRVVDERRAIDFEETVETAQGKRIYLAHKFPLVDAAGHAYAVCGIATDITDRKRNEVALRAAALAVSSAEGEGVFGELARYLAEILDVDVAMIAVHANGDRTRMRTLAACLDGKLLANFEYALEGSPCRHVVGRAFRFVGEGVHPEFPPGTLFAAKGMDSYAALPLNDSSGQALGLIATMDRRPMRDAALSEAMLKIFAMRVVAEVERTRTEAALRTSEASYRAIFEASEDAIFVHDWDTGAILDVSPKAEELYGHPADELRRMRTADISSNEPPYTDVEAGQWIEKAKSGPPIRYEWRARHRDGHLMWHEVRLKRATIAGQRRILAFTRDITASRSAEDALRASEEQYRAIFNASADALVLWNSRYQRVDVNPAYERMYGYTREEAVRGVRAGDLPAEYRKVQEEIVSRTLAGVPCHEELLETTSRDGRPFQIEVRTIPIRHRGEPHVLAMIRDVTGQKDAERRRAELEAQLRQAQKMEAIGHLTGGIAHDFNNLLTSIMGYVALAAERSPESDPKLATYLDQAGLSCGRARDLIQQMMTFSRGRRGEPRPLTLAPLVRESVKLLRSSFPATVDLRVELDDAAPPVMLDPVQLEQVLMNLAINARDAIRSSGAIGITVRRAGRMAAVCASCRHDVDGEFVELAVADSGSGIPPDVQERMFEPFFTTKPVGKGSGMGLSTVHGIVHEHGGHIIVESTAGRGATFRVLLPALQPIEGATARPFVPAAGERPRRPAFAGRVAVVDDEVSVAGFMKELLVNWGLSVAVFHDARAALDATAAGDAFDLVITDQTMPGVTGLEFARAARALRPGLQIVLYTGYGEGIAAAELERAGVVAVLRKPIEPSELQAVLKKHLPQTAPA